MCYQVEIWIEIKNFPGYHVSNLGRIKNHKGNIMSENAQGKSGKYLGLHLNNKTQKRKKELSHRLVCTHFKENPDELPTVNHKRNDPWHNFADNLEFASYKDQADWKNKLNKKNNLQIN